MSEAEIESKIKYIKKVIEKATFHVFTEEVYKEIDIENAQLKEMLEWVLYNSKPIINKIKDSNYSLKDDAEFSDFKEAIEKVKQLLNKE